MMTKKHMIRVIVVYILLLSSLQVLSQEEKNWGFGLRIYPVFTKPIEDNLKIDYKGEIGFGLEMFAKRNLYKNILFLNLGVNIENYSYSYRSKPYFYNYNIKYHQVRPALGIEYEALKIKSKLSLNITGGASFPQCYYKLTYSDANTSMITSRENVDFYVRQYINPFALISINYLIKERKKVGVFYSRNNNRNCIGIGYEF